MILYQLTQWLQEHTSIRKAIQQEAGDPGELMQRKEQVERQLMEQAERWRNVYADVPALPAADQFPSWSSETGAGWEDTEPEFDTPR
ncbi:MULTISPECIES: hypothetical protein [Paenibacillus]|uniref:hypothetical protein n=1 Tax=Paenibacillus TaxID=44249 RepID=UPI00020D702E|nr:MULTISPECIES: hypothetical protein [Paenibacillus]EGL19444.1 hypothetical protein HMPREF9413_4656 [Paenibacillus sp. HGF7]EPD82575.1 hypothetical protein HMPREF1207_03367 [Paenibacillus sp. HGH0039]MEC0247524.1 hypothetical protein [Paenibacillus chitinolyticus]